MVKTELFVHYAHMLKTYFPELIMIFSLVAIFISCGIFARQRQVQNWLRSNLEFYGLTKYYLGLIRLTAAITLIIGLTTIYATQIERKVIVINDTTVQAGMEARVVVLADIHLGIWKNKSFLDRVVDQVNQIPDVDVILIPGDLTYNPQSKDLESILSPLGRLKAPAVYAFGNHDVQHPGPDIKDELVRVLKQNKVIVLENQFDRQLSSRFDVYGVGDLWADENNVQALNDNSTPKPVIVVAHNPELFETIRPSQPAAIFTGHTHCGQIRIPFVYQHFLPDSGQYDKGLYKQDNRTMYISCGLGEVGLPMRLLNPPVIDVVNLKL
jgi:uncharacterized protein